MSCYWDSTRSIFLCLKYKILLANRGQIAVHYVFAGTFAGVMSYFSNFILLLNGGRNTGNGSLCLLILFDRVSKFNGIAP